jgi:hypothetical protein
MSTDISVCHPGMFGLFCLNINFERISVSIWDLKIFLIYTTELLPQVYRAREGVYSWE